MTKLGATLAAGAMVLAASSAAAAAPPAVYAIDSTGTLYAFDAGGSTLAHVAVGGPVGTLNGGGIAVDGSHLYVTLGEPANEVAVFDATTLARITLNRKRFAGLIVPRGIAYDTASHTLFIGSAGAGIGDYTYAGFTVHASGGFPGHDGPSGVAFDPSAGTIWVANYVGKPQSSPPKFGVSEYTATGAAAQTFDYATQFRPVQTPEHAQPYSIAFCARVTSGLDDIVEIGFLSDSSGLGVSEVHAYTTSGARTGEPFAGITNPRGLSCSHAGLVYVADDHGLLRFSSIGRPLPFSPGTFGGMTAPIYGVYAR